MKKLKAKIILSFLSRDLFDVSDEEYRERVSRHSYGQGVPSILDSPKLLTIRSADDGARRSNLKRELVDAGFKQGDEVVISLDAALHCKKCGLVYSVGCEHHERVRETHSEPLQFHELEAGDYFIAFPIDGDDSGHGGFRCGSCLLRKTMTDRTGPYNSLSNNYIRINNGAEGSIPPGMQVLKVCM